MSLAPARKGWCPSLLSPMPSGDGWLVRVKPTAATVSASAARLIADAARRHGNGHIDLTSRANFQLRGLTPESAERVADSVIGAGLARPDPSIERVRNVMASPLGPNDPSAAFDAHALALDLEAMLGDEPALQALPAKFGFLVDGGELLPLQGVTADIMVRAHRHRLAVQLEGGTRAAICSPAMLAETVRALALAFLHLSWERREPPRRMRALLMMTGEEAIFEAAGLTAVAAPPLASSPPSPIGFVPYSPQDMGAFGAGLPFGRIEAGALTALAALSETFGDGTLRTTPWRALLIPCVAADHSPALAAAIGALGLITGAADRRLALFACVGAPACTSASVDARADANRIAAESLAPGISIHVSGCAKGCAHSSPAALTLVGRDGRYDMVRDGSAGDTPTLTGLDIEQIIGALAGEPGAAA